MPKQIINGVERDIGPFADLGGANLRGADLRGADLRWANLRGADLGGADLHGANLHGVDLGGVYLYGANLRGADLGGANLRGADLREADLRWANLGEEKGKHVVVRIRASARRSDGYQFDWWETESGECIRAGCHTFTLKQFKTHIADQYPGTPKAKETLRILAFLKAQSEQEAWT